MPLSQHASRHLPTLSGVFHHTLPLNQPRSESSESTESPYLPPLPPSIPKSVLPKQARTPWAIPAVSVALLTSVLALAGAIQKKQSTQMQQSLSYYLNARSIPMVALGNLSLMDAMGRAQVFAINALRVSQAWMSNQHKWERLGFDAGQNWANLSMLNFIKGGLNTALLDAWLKPKVEAVPLLQTEDAMTWGQHLSHAWHNTIKLPFQRWQGLLFSPTADIFNPLRLKPTENDPLRWKAQDNFLNVLQHYQRTLTTETLFEELLKPTLMQVPQTTVLTKEARANLLQQLDKDVQRYCLELREMYNPKETIRTAVQDSLLALFDKKTGTFIRNKEGVPFEYCFTQARKQVSLYLQKYEALGQIAHISSFDRIVQTLLRQAPVRGSQLIDSAAHEVNQWVFPLKYEWEAQATNVSNKVRVLFRTQLEQALTAWEAGGCQQPLAQVVGKHIAPLAMLTKEGKLQGAVAQELDSLYKLNQRREELAQFQNNRNKALLAQNAIQTLITCLVIGNVLSFVVFNSVARLDADFDVDSKHQPAWNLNGVRRWVHQVYEGVQQRWEASLQRQLNVVEVSHLSMNPVEPPSRAETNSLLTSTQAASTSTMGEG